MVFTAHILFQVTKGYTWPGITKWGIMLMSLSPAKSSCCPLIQTKPVEHRTDLLKLGQYLEKAS